MGYVPAVLPTDDGSTRHSVLTTARRTAALVNALAGDRPEAVAEVLREYGEAEPVELTADDIARMRAAALLLREVFAAADVDRAAATLNVLLREHTGPLRLTSHGGAAPWHPHLDSHDDAPWDEWFLASSCMALAVLVWDRGRPPGGLCASPACENVYVSLGSGPARRYCSRRCATRERVAAHRRSRQVSEPGPPGPPRRR
ncbi:CGNR zinc finger domain-containing protein [Streptomyces avermitilis]|uniref:CGNR zinc finger domain-containing protein n=1 Tax=Streptomyces avermitilis TaxID=33903 RepID=UPI0033F47605